MTCLCVSLKVVMHIREGLKEATVEVGGIFQGKL